MHPFFSGFFLVQTPRLSTCTIFTMAIELDQNGRVLRGNRRVQNQIEQPGTKQLDIFCSYIEAFRFLLRDSENHIAKKKSRNA